MPENINQHWTKDEDLLAEYVLGRVTTAEQKRLEDHLRSCAVCREAVDAEKKLAGGIQQYARDGMKSRLEARLASRPHLSRGFGAWQRLASLAAVLVIVFGVGLYNRWFPWQGRVGMMEEQTKQMRPEANGEVHQPQKDLKSTEAASTPEMSQQRDGHIAELKEGPPAGIRRSEQAISAPPVKQGERFDELDPTNAEKGLQAGAGGEMKQQEIARDEIKEWDAHSGEMPVWVEGVVLGKPGVAQDSHEQPLPSAAARLDAAKSEAMPRNAMARKKAQAADIAGEVSLHQRLVKDLPVSRQQVQVANRRLVQAMVHGAGERLEVTLYLDTLLSEEDLATARIEQPGGDSLLIGVASEEIAFKLPKHILRARKSTGQSNVK